MQLPFNEYNYPATRFQILRKENGEDIVVIPPRHGAYASHVGGEVQVLAKMIQEGKIAIREAESKIEHLKKCEAEFGATRSGTLEIVDYLGYLAVCQRRLAADKAKYRELMETLINWVTHEDLAP